MSNYQLYKKQQVAVVLEIDSPSFIEEKYQLIEQGFERIGDVVQAKNKTEALKHTNQVNIDSLSEFATSHLFVSCIVVLGAIASYFRFS
ncbi:hypothetical protein CW745_04435 [Psychromonas sp. psych-6C06]|uniref:hypothetical protein n=1 Tax=Psychromonas sp. psych-6C06 TaxID=2058089 RepID=UPI000C33661F|nr:hypothetical protein [Psychromonas sp. psych-6C06]PKF62677.1 hypothetical protein CW745_04435 [Psychromonas sp. psych-6C06]